MAFSTNCPHKGCRKIIEPYIDQKTDKVYCSECDGEIVNLTYFAKMQMKNSKQFRQKVATSFSVKCNSCGKEDKPVLIDDEPACRGCKKALSNLTRQFKIMLKEQLKLGSDIK